MFFSLFLTPLSTALILLLGMLAYSYANWLSIDRLTPEARLSQLTLEDDSLIKSKWSLDWIIPRFKSKFDDNKFTYGLAFSALALLLISKAVITKLSDLRLLEIQQYFAFTALVIFFASMIILYVIDHETLTMPKNVIYFTLLASGALLIIGAILGKDYVSIQHMFLAAGIGFIFYFAIWWFYPKGFGFSDVRLALPVGLVLGWVSIQTAIVAIGSPFILATIGIILLLPFKKLDRKKRFAFGPWIIIGSVFALIWGDLIINYIA